MIDYLLDVKYIDKDIKSDELKISDVIKYNTSIICNCNGKLMSILNQERDILPNSIVLYRDSFASFISSIVNNDSYKIKLNLKKAKSLSLRLKNDINKNCLIEKNDELSSFIDNFSSNDDLINQIKETIQSIKNNEEVKQYIGLGSGSTPSFDDALVGVQAVYNLFNLDGYKKEINEIINFNLVNTTLTSEWQFRYALEGKYPKVLVSYFENPNFVNLLNFLKHGSNSGMDMLVGVFYAIESIRS